MPDLAIRLLIVGVGALCLPCVVRRMMQAVQP